MPRFLANERMEGNFSSEDSCPSRIRCLIWFSSCSYMGMLDELAINIFIGHLLASIVYMNCIYLLYTDTIDLSTEVVLKNVGEKKNNQKMGDTPHLKRISSVGNCH